MNSLVFLTNEFAFWSGEHGSQAASAASSQLTSGAPGTSQISIHAVDRWSNSCTTNLSITRSSLAFTIDAPDANQIHQSLMSVSGTVAGPAYTVWVNDQPATLAQDGSWSAQNVPVTPGGTAIFRAVAYSPGHDGESAFANERVAATEKPVRFYVEHNILTQTGSNAGEFVDYNVFTMEETDSGHGESTGCYSHNWFDGTDSHGDWDERSSSHYEVVWPPTSGGSDTDCSANLTWPASYWPFPGGGVQAASGDCDWNVIEPISQIGPPIIEWKSGSVGHHTVSAWDLLDVGDFLHVQSGWAERADYTFVQTTLKLFTGGKAIPRRENLFSFSGWANEIPLEGAERPIPFEQIKIGDVGSLGADGWLYAALPDNVTRDVTPRVEGKKYYRFFLEPAKYILRTQTFAMTPPDRGRTAIGVGEEVSLFFDPALPVGVAWEVSGGTLSANSGNQTVFTAPDSARSGRVTARVGGGSCSLSFGVVEPSGVLFVNRQHGLCFVPSASGDFFAVDYIADVYIPPDNVNFYAITLAESSAVADRVGYYENKFVPNHPPNSGHSMDGSVVPGKGSHMSDPDSIGMNAAPSPYYDGSATYPIGWSYQIGSGPQRFIETVTQRATLECSEDDATFKVTKQNSGYLIRQSTGGVEPAY